MFSKINHVAIVSENYAKSALFYQSVFGMRTSDKTRTSRAQTVGDGYVGLNINPKKAGRAAGLDHFGIEVEDTAAFVARIEEHGGTILPHEPGDAIKYRAPDGTISEIVEAGRYAPSPTLPRKRGGGPRSGRVGA